MGTKSHHSFELKRAKAITGLNIDFEEYTHITTKAQHIHLKADNKENVFMVALRTVPEDSTGVAHILEHTALCGSEKYPVRDPFFMMIRRSLNTFMNAFTSSDWTAYPFASQNRKDFDNLLKVYLDSVFFARLDPLDFAQEGHRLEFSNAEDCDTPLTFKGVVFNEMKGAMSSINSTLWQTTCKFLYPTNTYHHNSGGDPTRIPDLTYDQFKEFYRVHYHPSNSIFITYGNIPAAEHQEKFDALALSRFERLNCHIAVKDEERYEAPKQFVEGYASNPSEPSDKKTHVIIAWLLGDSTNLEETMQARLLSSVLLDHSGSPLMQALETSEFGTSPSPLCGLEDSQKQLCFACGIEGSEEFFADSVEQAILDVLKNVAENGLEEEQIAASLHQLELQQREISAGRFPFGLNLALTALTSATHRGDPVALLDLEPTLKKLREQIKQPEFIKTLVRTLLLENPHRIRLVMPPDGTLADQREAAERERLLTIQNKLTTLEKKAIIDQAKALQSRQEASENANLLPKVGIEDIPKEISYSKKMPLLKKAIPITAYQAGTNGLVYQQAILPVPALEEQFIDLIPLYTACVTQLGVGNRTYQETQQWQATLVGSYAASADVRTDKSDLTMLRGNLCYTVKGLVKNQVPITEFFQESIYGVRFNELSRIKELVSQIKNQRESSVVSNGHALAMASAASGLSASAHLNQRWSGLTAVSHIKELDKLIDDPKELSKLADKLASIHSQVINQDCQFLIVAESGEILESISHIESTFRSKDGIDPITPENIMCYPYDLRPKSLCWTTNTQVNYCAMAFPTVASTHEDAAALTVLGGILRNGFLHRKIREQGGAYGSGAGQDNNSGAFRFFSYRDPRLKDTLNDFDESVQWVLSNPISFEKIEESILGVISTLDKPGTPVSEAISAFHRELNGRNKSSLLDFRERVLNVSEEAIKKACAKYLTPQTGITSVITSAQSAKQLNLEIKNL